MQAVRQRRPDHLRHGVGDGAELPLAFCQGLKGFGQLQLGGLALTDVDGNAGKAGRPPGSVGHDLTPGQHPAHGAILAPQPVFALEQALVLQRLIDLRGDPLDIIGMKSVHEAPDGDAATRLLDRDLIHAGELVVSDDTIVDDIPVPGPDIGRGLQGPGGARVALAPLLDGPTQLQLGHDLIGQHLEGQHLQLGRALRAWLRVQHTQGADRHAFRRFQHPTGVEAQTRHTGDQGVAGEPRVFARIGDHHPVLLENGVGAEGGFQRRLAHPKAGLGLEELPVVGNQIDHRHGRLERSG